MASGQPALTVVYAALALKDLQKIWIFNAKSYRSIDHADEYLAFLKSKIDALATTYPEGKIVDTNARLRYLIVKRSLRGHGHIVVYRLTATNVRILHVFHTSQNWREKVRA